MDPVPEAHVAEDRPASLGHAVELALLHVAAIGQGGEGQDLARQDHSLPPDTGHQHVGHGHGHTSTVGRPVPLSTRTMASTGHSWAQMAHPMHSHSLTRG